MSSLRDIETLVASRLPKGYRVAADASGETAVQYVFVVDDQGRRRTYAYGPDSLEGLASEIRRLALEVRRIANWKRKLSFADGEIDALATDLCPFLYKSKGERWGRTGPGAVDSDRDMPAGLWWIHEDSGFLPAPADRAIIKGHDLYFPDGADFAKFLIALKENRFHRSSGQGMSRQAAPSGRLAAGA